MDKIFTIALLHTYFLISMDFSVETAPATLSGVNRAQENLTENQMNATRAGIPSSQIYKPRSRTMSKKIMNRLRCLGDNNINHWRCLFSCSWCHRFKISSSFSSFIGVTKIPDVPQEVDYYSPGFLNYNDYPDPDYGGYHNNDYENLDYHDDDYENAEYQPDDHEYLEYHYDEEEHDYYDYGQHYEYNNYNHEDYSSYDLTDNTNQYFDDSDFVDEWDHTDFTSSFSYSTFDYDF